MSLSCIAGRGLVCLGLHACCLLCAGAVDAVCVPMRESKCGLDHGGFQVSGLLCEWTESNRHCVVSSGRSGWRAGVQHRGCTQPCFDAICCSRSHSNVSAKRRPPKIRGGGIWRARSLICKYPNTCQFCAAAELMLAAQTHALLYTSSSTAHTLSPCGVLRGRCFVRALHCVVVAHHCGLCSVPPSTSHMYGSKAMPFVAVLLAGGAVRARRVGLCAEWGACARLMQARWMCTACCFVHVEVGQMLCGCALACGV